MCRTLTYIVSKPGRNISKSVKTRSVPDRTRLHNGNQAMMQEINSDIGLAPRITPSHTTWPGLGSWHCNTLLPCEGFYRKLAENNIVFSFEMFHLASIVQHIITYLNSFTSMPGLDFFTRRREPEVHRRTSDLVDVSEVDGNSQENRASPQETLCPRDPDVYYNPRLDPQHYLDGPLSWNPSTRLRQMLARPGIVVRDA
jgi:hypothetical protein